MSNPSFEGPKGINKSPPGWLGCHSLSTPDTQPGYWGVTKTPSHGNSYLSLVVRGNKGPYANTTEDIQTNLMLPLQQGECYNLSIDLAISENGGHLIGGGVWLSYYNPAFLKIWGGFADCVKSELLWASDPIDNTQWETYEFTISPQDSSYDYLILEAAYTSLPKYFGNILIDDIRLPEAPQTLLVLDTTVKIGQEFVLYPSKGAAYSWSPSTNLSCSTCRNPSFTVQEPATYQVIITDANGCQFTEEFIIWMDLIIPNVFTPGYDDINDFFEIQGLRPGASLQVYNRWGALIYESDNYQNNWDGRSFSGEELAEDVYYFVLETNIAGKSHTGFVQIIR